MELSTFATYVGLARDFLILAIGLTCLVIAVVLFRKVSRVVDSVSKTAKAVEQTAAALSDKATGPAGAGVTFGVSKSGSMLWRLVKRRSKGGRNNE